MSLVIVAQCGTALQCKQSFFLDPSLLAPCYFVIPIESFPRRGKRGVKKKGKKKKFDKGQFSWTLQKLYILE